MEFRFNISKIFKNNISRVSSSMLPSGFVGNDQRCASEAASHVQEIINVMGEASAKSQKLNHVVTTADRLRSSDGQIIYLMTEENERNGAVIGFLKIGHKSLYVFDKYGETRHVQAPCVMDFYIHETHQRRGFGKMLFDYMLDYENLLPEQMAIDTPNQKFISFYGKHYGCTHKIPQMNPFVIYEGFFNHHHADHEANETGRKHAILNSDGFEEDEKKVDFEHRHDVVSDQEELPEPLDDELSTNIDKLNLHVGDFTRPMSGGEHFHVDREFFDKDDPQNQQHFRNMQNIDPFHYHKRQCGLKHVSNNMSGADEEKEFGVA